MARPSQQIDEALLRSGRALYPALGCAGLSQRKLAEHAGVSPGMFHYHFASKDEFLRTLLQQLYEEMFTSLAADATEPGPALQRLRHALFGVACFLRDHRPLLMRLMLDAANGEAVPREFLRANAPRHLGLLAGLMLQAQQGGELPPTRHPLQRATFVFGAVLAPLVVVPAIAALGVALPGPPPATQVGSDQAIRQRITMALAALQQTQESA
jgi:AcrR family transcriptional regulator